MAHAARYPDAVSHLVLVVTAAHNGFIERSRQIVRERGTPEQQEVLEDSMPARCAPSMRCAAITTSWGRSTRVAFDASKAAAVRGRATPAPDALNRAFAPGGFMWNYDLRPELARITAPTLILAGRHDWICAPEFSEEIHRLIPGSDLRIFEHSSHSIRVDEPAALVDAIRGFVVYKAAVSPPSTNST